MKQAISYFVIFLLFLNAAPAKAIGPYIDNGNSTVTDQGTGLIWQQQTGATHLSWQEALTYCANLSQAGRHDWRLPNIRELESLIDYSRFEPALDPLFNCQGSSCWYCFWSATTSNTYPNNAWTVRLGSNGGNIHVEKTSPKYVRCVRGGLSTGPIQTVDISVGATSANSTEPPVFGKLKTVDLDQVDPNSNVSLNPNQELFVIVHGWNPTKDNLTEIPPNSWPTNMGIAIRDNTGVDSRNVLLWDWMDEARDDHDGTNVVQRTIGVSYNKVPDSGRNLANQLNELIQSNNYHGHIHMIGHSLGSGVIIYAAKRLKETFQRENVKQLTLLDSPWIARYPAGDFLKDNQDTLFVDNYLTMFGRPQGYRYADLMYL